MTEQPALKSSTTTPIPWWITTIVILGTLLTAAGGVIALLRPEMLIGSGQQMNIAAAIYADYLVSRDLALAFMLLVMLFLRARQVLAGLMVLAALTQLIDAVMDIRSGRASLLPILIIFAIAFLIGAARLAGHAPWQAAAWQSTNP